MIDCTNLIRFHVQCAKLDRLIEGQTFVERRVRTPSRRCALLDVKVTIKESDTVHDTNLGQDQG
jgi:hypothetical protein